MKGKKSLEKISMGGRGWGEDFNPEKRRSI